MFKKIAFACATLAIVSAQDLNALANQALDAVAPVVAQSGALTQNADGVSLNVNNYEWSLTEVNGEYDLNVEQTAGNANNLAPTLSALLANVASVVQDNNAVGVLDSEAANVGVAIENASEAASQAGDQLANNADALTELASQQYNNAAAALAANQDGITDQANAQANNALQDQASLNAAVNNGVDAAVNNAGAATNLAADNANNLPVDVQVNGDANAVSNAVNNAVGSSNANDAAAAANNLANQGLDAAANAANNNLASNLADNVSGAAGDAANNAANTLNANGVGDVNSATAAALNANQ